ncbi:MAG: hypothetical protein ABIG95_05825 [Candidatus Woesearchaeota archaeon]
MIKKRLGKKGDVSNETLFTIFELIVFLFFAYIMFSFVRDIERSTLFEKNYLARDIALVIDSVYASPHKTYYAYPENVSRFQISAKLNKVRIKEAEQEGEHVDKIYWFADDFAARLIMAGIISETENIAIAKSRNNAGDFFKVYALPTIPKPEKSPVPTPERTPAK